MFVNNLDQAPLKHFETLDSTMSKAAELASQQRDEGLAILATHQSAGRGRRGREWLSGPNAGLWATLVLRPQRTPNDWPSLGIVFAVSLAQSLEALTKQNLHIKWPNDIWFNDSKLAGILLEQVDDGEALAIGFGINYVAPQGTDSAQLRHPAIGLEALLPELPTPEDLLRKIRRDFSAPYNGWSLGNWETIRSQFSARNILRGSRVSWEHEGSSLIGTAGDIDERGHLVVTLEDGTQTSLLAAEVERITLG